MNRDQREFIITNLHVYGIRIQSSFIETFSQGCCFEHDVALALRESSPVPVDHHTEGGPLHSHPNGLFRRAFSGRTGLILGKLVAEFSVERDPLVSVDAEFAVARMHAPDM
jgi:hypothetical protein